MRYLIALPLEDSESKSFIELRDKFKVFAPRWKITLGPHITLYRPSEFKLNREDAIKKFKQAPKMSEFSVGFDGFDAFMNHSNNAVYSEPKDHVFFEKIKDKYQAIAENILQDSSDIWPYHPHLTLVNRLDTESAIKLMEELKKTKFYQNYQFNRVVLYKKEHDDKNWVELASNKLEK